MVYDHAVSTGETPRRGARISGDIWVPALAKAKRHGTTVTAVIERALIAFLAEAEPASPDDITGPGGFPAR
jgi:hypothetical protein